ncbi:MAG: type II secretion system F family protein [Actinomycetota bacterium]|nr:type II secretion system F family protein [Actinomycetota bacterium]
MIRAAAGCLVGAALLLLCRPLRTTRREPFGTRGAVPDGEGASHDPLPRTGHPRAVTATLAGAVAAAGVLAGPVASGLVAVVGWAALARVAASRRAAAKAAEAGAEVELLATLAAELRAGRPPLAALAAADVPLDPALAGVMAQARGAAAFGGDVAAALRRAAPARTGILGLAAGWQVSERAGAPLAEVLGQVEREVRAQLALSRSADAELAGARATGALLAGLPVLGLGLGHVMGAAPLHILLHTAAGAVCAAGGAVLELAGLAWVTRLTDNASRAP